MGFVKQPQHLKLFPPSPHPRGKLVTGYMEELHRFQTPFARGFVVIGVVCFFGLLPFVTNDYILHLFNMACIYAIVAVGLNIITGYAGQLSLGHGALFGIGTYTGVLLSAKAGLPFFLAVPIGGVVALTAGSILAIPSLHLRPIYLPMATLAGQFIAEYIFLHWVSLTGGSQGPVAAKITLGGWILETHRSLFYITAIFLLLTLWLADNLIRGKIGRALEAIRQNDRVAAALGIAVYPHKLLAFAISAFFAGLAGALFAYAVETITPSLFSLTLSIEFLAIIIVGGLGSISGSLLGAVVIVFLNEILTFLGGWLMNSDSYAGSGMAMMPLNEFGLGLVIVIFIIFKPKGLASICRNIKRRFQRWPFS
jgi:branched-chain amino acid transport system permease protein